MNVGEADGNARVARKRGGVRAFPARWLLAVCAASWLAACASSEPVPVPKVVGEWWRIAGNPDLGAYTTADQQPVDFAIWRAADGTWQLWSCIRHTAYPGETRLFHRWEGRRLTDTDWTPMGIAMTSEPGLGETQGGLQAPFVFERDGVYHLFYGDFAHIARATSHDGKTFVRRVGPDDRSGMFYEDSLGANTRDPMVIEIDGLFHLYYTAHPLPPGTPEAGADYSQGLGAVYLRTSRDLTTWSASRKVAAGGAAGHGTGTAESPFVYFHQASGYFYLFRTQRYGPDALTSVYRSRDPGYFGVDDDRFLVATLPVAAPEIVKDGGETYIAALMPDLKGIQIARLAFVARR